MDNPLLYTLPLDAFHKSLDALMAGFAGYSMPVHYADGIIAEHRWTRAHAGLFDVSHMGQLLVTGDGADRWLETLMPGDFLSLGENVMRYSMLLNERGGIIDDLIVTRLPEGIGIVVNGANKSTDIAHMKAHLPSGLLLHHLEDQALLALQGPAAAAVLDNIVPGASALKFMRHGRFQWQGITLSVSRSGYTGEDGFEISLPAASAQAFAEQLLADPVVKPVGLGARDSLRLEAGLPLHGHELDEDTTPVEAGLGFAISKRRRVEGGFPGSERLLVELFDGPLRQRIGLRFDGRQPVREGAAISADGVQTGSVTSGGFGPSVEAPIAMGYVKSAHAVEGNPLQVEVRGRQLDARVAPLPFIQKHNAR